MTTNMKEKIKSVSIRLFHKKGYFATGVSDIAKGCGIRKASIYYHYPTKEDILLDIFMTTMTELESHLIDSIAHANGSEEKLRAAIRSHILFHIDRQKEVIIADSELRGLSPENYQTMIQMRDQHESHFQTLIKQGMEAGFLAEGDVRILSYAILTMCTAVATWFSAKGRLPKEDIICIYENFILNGLKGGTIGTDR